MKKLLLEYSQIIGYTICGLVFGFSFFLLFLNFYHYKEVNITYQKNEDDLNVAKDLSDELAVISGNTSQFNMNSYKGVEELTSMASVKSRLDLCVKNINNNEAFDIINKNEVSISDVYKLQQLYQANVVNDCLIKQLYDLSIIGDNQSIKISSLAVVSPFIGDSIEQLKNGNDYLQNNIKNNSSYSFSSESAKLNIFNVTKDSYYQIVSSYRKSLDFVKDVSVWYRSVVGVS